MDAVAVPHQAVLVVDDDALVRVTVAEMLAAAGIPVLAAGSAEEAAEKLSGRPALALVDLFLPGEQGDAFCRSVRLHPDLWDLPLVMITSDDRPESVRRCFLAGADDYLLKPLQERLLLAKIAAVRSPSAVHLAPPARHKRVLLSTERLFFGTVMGRLLEKAGYQVVRACVPRELDDLGPEPVALAIVDLDLPQAAPLVGRLQAASPAIAVVAVVSQKGAAALPRALSELSPYDVDTEIEHLVRRVNKLLVGSSRSDRRAAQRVSFHSVVQFRSWGEDEWLAGYSFDLSETGVYVRTLTPLAASRPVEVTFRLEPGADPLMARGLVVWSNPYGPRTVFSYPYGMGVTFSDFPVNEWSRLREFIKARKNAE